MTNNQNIINVLYSNLPKFSETDRKIANKILEDPSKIVNITIANLAKMTDVSEASVSRFCRNIDLNGFHQLKIELAKVAEDKNNYYHQLNADNVEQSLASIGDNKVSEIITTLKATSSENIQEALTLLKKATMIQCVATGGTYPVALDASYKFNQLGIFTVAEPSWEVAVAQTLNLPENSAVFIISNSGETLNLITQAKIAKQNKAKIIALTNREDSPLAQLADVHILTAVRQQIFESDYFFSRLSATTVVEALFLLLLSGNKEYFKHIKRHEEIISQTKI